MSERIITNGNKPYEYNGPPDKCPICHYKISPKQLNSVISIDSDTGPLQVVYQCTNKKCLMLFIALYTKPFYSNVFQLIKLYPATPENREFSQIISNLSPRFVEIYNQAITAEAYHLPELVGIGLRKSLEFLMKDYLIKQKPDKETEIRKNFLGKCIELYVDDINIKVCAERATWLGNDETHYERKWEDKDIKDLKNLIELTVTWIELNIRTKNYLEEMAEGRS